MSSIFELRRLFIYTLSDPRTGEVRYVGRTHDPTRRLREHLTDGHGRDREAWIRSLVENSLLPVLTIVEEPSAIDCNQREAYWVRHFQALGAKLVNNRINLSNRGRHPETDVEFSARFWSKVDCSGNKDGCWPWLAAKVSDGYGAMGVGRVVVSAHRIAYELAVQPISPGMEVLHSCDNRACCNPSHLRVGTHAENMRDRSLRGRVNARAGDEHPARQHPERMARGEKNGNARIADTDVEAIRERYLAGEPVRLIAASAGVDRTTIYHVLRGTTWRHIGTVTPESAERLRTAIQGEHHWQSKLTESDVLAIRARCADGETQRQIARSYNITQSLVSQIHQRRVWKHLPE